MKIIYVIIINKFIANISFEQYIPIKVNAHFSAPPDFFVSP